MRKKVWNFVCIAGLMSLACGLYLFGNVGINNSWAKEADGTVGSSKSGNTGGCAGYNSYPPRCSAGYETKSVKVGSLTCYTSCKKKSSSGGGGAPTTSACGDYVAYPPRCNDGYTSDTVSYNGKTCYTSCKKKEDTTKSDFCSSGTAFANIAAAQDYCKDQGYITTSNVGSTTSGKVCATCSEKKQTCSSQYGEFDSEKKAISECGGLDFVKSASRLLNGKESFCYGCKPKVQKDKQCGPTNVGYCLSVESCQSVGGIWALGTCKARYSSYGEFCASMGYSYTKKTCPENFESVLISSTSSTMRWDCYSDCIPTHEFEEVLNCEELYLTKTKPNCGNDKTFYEVDGIGGHTTCYSDCISKDVSKICEKNGLKSYQQVCPSGTKSYQKEYDNITCYTPCQLPVSKETPECYLCSGKALYGNYATSKNCFPLGLSEGSCISKSMTEEDWRTYIYGGEPWGQPWVEVSYEGSFEKDPQIYVYAEKDGWSVYATTSTDFPTDQRVVWRNVPYVEGSKTGVEISLHESGTYYIYSKDSQGFITLIDVKNVTNPAKNTINNLGVSYNVENVDYSTYYGSGLTTKNTQTVSEHTVIAPQSRTSGTKGTFQMLSVNKKEYGIKLIGDSKTDKTLTVDPETGLLLYTLSEEEKASLGITTEKVYVVASKEETRLTRNADGTFTKSETGDTLAGSKNELGTIYKITPKNDISTMSEYIFYGINLAYIENADYSNSNTWNDINLLSYNNTTTANTDFTFEIVRNGYSDVVKQLSSSNALYKIVPLASSTTDNLGTFYIDFSSDVTQYEFSIDDDEITLNPVLVYTDSKYVEGYGPRTIKLNYGLNVEYIKVESSKGAVRTYTLLITRMDSRSSDNTLSSLVARSVDLTPTFTKYTNEYYGTVVNSVKSVEIAAEKSSNEATFVEGYGSRTVDLKVGENTILVKVKSETEAERTYKIIITREGKAAEVVVDKTKSANNNLKALYISSGNLMFDSKVLNYNLYVTNDITSILVTPTLEDAKATYAINKAASLQMGSNKIEVVVTAENGETKTYTINVIRKEAGLAISTDSTLSTLQIKGENISFSPTKYLYNVTIFPGTEELKFYLEPSNEKAQIEVIGNQELSDFTTVKIKVIAEDGSYSIYDINVKVDNITKEEIIIFAGCAVLFLGLVVFGTISRNKKKKNNL